MVSPLPFTFHHCYNCCNLIYFSTYHLVSVCVCMNTRFLFVINVNELTPPIKENWGECIDWVDWVEIVVK